MPDDYLLADIHRHRQETWRWQRRMERPLTKASASARRSPGPRYRRWVLRLWKQRAARARHEARRHFVSEANRHFREARRWERLMGVPRRRPRRAPRRIRSAEVAWEAMRTWETRAAAARRRARNPPRLRAWLCIHRYEGPWNDPSPPYYGGLQMDWSFMRTYGGELLRTKGTADNWTPLEQIWVAERAYRAGRGFYPWPNTARYCGLL